MFEELLARVRDVEIVGEPGVQRAGDRQSDHGERRIFRSGSPPPEPRYGIQCAAARHATRA